MPHPNRTPRSFDAVLDGPTSGVLRRDDTQGLPTFTEALNAVAEYLESAALDALDRDDRVEFLALLHRLTWIALRPTGSADLRPGPVDEDALAALARKRAIQPTIMGGGYYPRVDSFGRVEIIESEAEGWRFFNSAVACAADTLRAIAEAAPSVLAANAVMGLSSLVRERLPDAVFNPSIGEWQTVPPADRLDAPGIELMPGGPTPQEAADRIIEISAPSAGAGSPSP